MTRLALIAVAAWAASSLGPGVACEPCDLTSSPVLNGLSRWDGGWYVDIASDGYAYVPGERSNVAFAPLLPFAMRALTALVGRSDETALIAAGVLISHLALLVALAYLVVLGRLDGDEVAGRRAALYLLVFPTSVFLSAVYPTSLFLALALGAMVEARRRRWPLAAAFGALAALARPLGGLLVVPLLVEALAQRRSPGTRVAPVAAAAAPLAAFGAWQLHLYWRFGDPLLYLHAQEAYGREPSLPLKEVADLLDPRVYGFPWIVAGVLVFMIVLVAWSMRRSDRATAAYGAVFLVASLSSGTLTSFPRYALELFPAFLVLAHFGARRGVHLTYVTVAALMSLVLTAMFAGWYWIG